MKNWNVVIKRIAMALAVVTVVAAASGSDHMTVEASKTQMMNITCPRCHKTIEVDVMQNDVQCEHCLEHIHIDG